MRELIGLYIASERVSGSFNDGRHVRRIATISWPIKINAQPITAIDHYEWHRIYMTSQLFPSCVWRGKQFPRSSRQGVQLSRYAIHHRPSYNNMSANYASDIMSASSIIGRISSFKLTSPAMYQKAASSQYGVLSLISLIGWRGR
mmetsp:Transcript_15438/g.33436  ORF Transcript_15438/g.33436 Transcript_15438/m.33436 type:complete len:145 (-) Transcript_15438:146-580(-)